MAPFLEEKKKQKRMMNAIGMFIVNEILQAWIPSMCVLMQVTMTT